MTIFEIVESIEKYIKSPSVLIDQEFFATHQFTSDLKDDEPSIIVNFPQFKGNAMGLLMILERYNLRGLGLVLNLHNSNPSYAFHLDQRSQLRNNQAARWISFVNAKGERNHIPMSIKDLKRLKVLI